DYLWYLTINLSYKTSTSESSQLHPKFTNDSNPDARGGSLIWI
ncbi:hypothetical protein AC249_AIPGENE3669, partial [Exaiptasia diaphana]